MSETKHQVIFIRGGETFDTKEQFYNYLKTVDFNPYEKKRTWRDWLEWSLSEKFDSIAPLMPNKQWADYEAWKIWFERVTPYINKDKNIKLILIGQSLGGIFLAKYLSENKLPKKIDQLHLVSPLFDNEKLEKEKVASFAFDPEKLSNLELQADKLFLYHSRDDPYVPFEHALKYLQYLKKAEFFEFQDRGHFAQPAFMEILQVINKNL
ncbi:MAG: alpha/beta hydrolase [Candidatus Nanoarchaeia archaeon]